MRSSRNSEAGSTLVDKQVVSRTGAGDVKELAFGVIDLLQVCIVADGWMRPCEGMISSSQAMTATARNSRPLARCIVMIGR